MIAMSLKFRIVACACLIVSLVAAVAITASIGVSRLDGAFQSLQKHQVTTKIETIKIGREVNYVSRLTRNIMLGADYEKDMKKLDETEQKIVKSFDVLAKASDTPDAKRLVEQAKADTLAFVEDGKRRMAALKDVPAEERYTAFKEYEKGATPLAMKSRESFDAIIKKADDGFEKGGKEFAGTLQSSLYVVLAASAVAVVLVVAAFWALLILVLGPVVKLKETLAGIRSSWNLTCRLDDSRRDEMGDIARETNAFIEALHDVIGVVSSSTDRVTAAASGLNATAGQMAVSVEEVAAQTATVAQASEEMNSTTVDIATNCQQAAELSNHAREVASQGGTVVRESVAGMERIARKVKESASTVEALGARSDQIGEIVATIQDIADQTNLLALNAAIEAARAGEMGRGFAVVADEVRALAERTTKATREISDMIKSIQQETKDAVGTMEEGVREVEQGTGEAAKSGAALDEIMASINDLSAQVHQIAVAAEEQSATVGEIATNINKISDVIQATSAGTQDASRAAENLTGYATDLRRAVQRFAL